MRLILMVFLVLLPISYSLVSHSSDLHGNLTEGYYYVDLYLGTPPQKQSFIVDTGSSVFALPCNMCTSCGLRHINPKFDVGKSNTSKLLTCQTGGSFCSNCTTGPNNGSCGFSTNYAQGSSLSGIMVEDVIGIERRESNPGIRNSDQNNNLDQGLGQSIRAVFGCITKETHLFLNQKADGIIGLSPKQISNILASFKSHTGTVQGSYSFSICLAQNGGSFTFGGLNSAVQRQNPIVLKYRSDYQLYSLIIDDILVGQKSLGIGTLQVFTGQGIILDSGSTFTYFPYGHYQTALEAIQTVCNETGCKEFSGEDSKCYQFPTTFNQTQVSFEEQLDKFPTIFLKLGLKRILWAPKDYFMMRNQQRREACLGFLPLNRWILGTTWMVNRDILYDIDNGQVTIYDSRCGSKEPVGLRRMYSSDKSPLTEMFTAATSQNVFMAIGMVFGVIVLVILTAVVAFLFLRRQEHKANPLPVQMQSGQVLELSSEQDKAGQQRVSRAELS